MGLTETVFADVQEAGGKYSECDLSLIMCVFLLKHKPGGMLPILWDFLLRLIDKKSSKSCIILPVNSLR